MSLLKKLVIWFAAGIIILVLLLAVVFSVQLSTAAEESIKRNMSELMACCASAMKQSLYINGLSSDKAGFAEAARNTAEELNSMLGCGIACYDMDGKALFSTYGTGSMTKRERQDLGYAMQGKNAYTLVRRDDVYTAYLSFTVNSGGESIGIMRLQIDYSEIYLTNRRTFTTMIISSAAVLIVATSLLALMILRMLKPIKNLSEELVSTAKHPERAKTLPVASSDEIGLLTAQYNKMALTIRSQMTTIKKESERLTKTLEYKKAFYDNLTHELKTPLTIILGYAEMMEQTDFEDQDFVKKGTEQIITESKRLTGMVAALLENSRSETAVERFEKIDALELISAVVFSMSVKAQRYGANIKTSLCEACVEGSEERLRQLYVNLIDNAIKYGLPAHDIRVNMSRNGNVLEVSISNYIENGRKFEDAEKMFIPFYRSRDVGVREDGSVGLGLSICKNIIEEHSGTITANEKDGVVTFKTTLPLYGGYRIEED